MEALEVHGPSFAKWLEWGSIALQSPLGHAVLHDINTYNALPRDSQMVKGS